MTRLLPKPIIHGRDHGCGGADPIPGICDLASLIGTVSEAIIATEPLAYYKLDETVGDWADSADARDATYDSQAGTVRGVASELDEGDGSLCVTVDGPAPTAGLDVADAQVGHCDDALFSIEGTASFTATVRIRAGSIPSGVFSAGICGNALNSAGGGSWGWGFYIYGTDASLGAKAGKVFARRSAGGVPDDIEARGVAALSTGVWLRLTATFDGSSGTLKLFGDDVLLATTTDASPYSIASGNASTLLSIGCAAIQEGFGGTAAPFDGEIDSLAVWGRALSDGEVGGIVDAEAGGLPPGPEGPPGPTGPTGPTGATGAGVPTGGTTGQVLTKTSSSDYATNWQTPSAGGDPATDTSVWMPLFDSDGSPVFDDTDQVIPVLIPL